MAKKTTDNNFHKVNYRQINLDIIEMTFGMLNDDRMEILFDVQTVLSATSVNGSATVYVKLHFYVINRHQ